MHAITHVVLSAALAYITGLPLVLLVIGGVFPDSDLLFTDFLSHRVELHSLLVIGLISLGIWQLIDKRGGLAFAIGAVFHIICDIFTPMGVAILWPFINSYYTLNTLISDSMYLDITVILVSVFLLINYRKIKETLMDIENFGRYFTIGIISFFVMTALFGQVKLIGCPSTSTSIESLLLDKQSYSEKYVMVNGTVCSNITSKYYASSGNTYQIFYLCDKESRIVVWKNLNVGENEIKENDTATVCGAFTIKYEEPEIYNVNSFVLNS